VTLLLVAVGGAVGAPLRYLAGHLFDGRFPAGTVAVNLLGSFLLGLFTGFGLDGSVMALLGAGFCGALTTFSSFAVQTYEHGPRVGAVNVLLTVVPALALCGLGFWLAR
jgi:CrcB protein